MGLVLTSAKASFSGVSGGLIDLLIEYGDSVDVRSTEALYGSLINHAPRAAEKLIELGAKPDLFVAAGLGNMELVRACFDESGRVKARPRRHGRVLSQRDSIGLAMLVAYVRDQRAVVDFLLERDGNWNMVGVNNGTALHRAASQDDLPMVERLVRLGADISDRNNPFVATPLSWADHLGHPRIVQWFRSNCAIDIHDAVCFDFLEHVEARLTENPASVNERRSQWSTPQATPLHCAAMTNRPELAAHLLDRGADPSLIAGNGLTALEMAQRSEATELVRLLS
jgi:ankyrin repeat protein